MFSNKWKACSDRLCSEHCETPKDGKGHCFSDPKTDCEQRYDFAKYQNKKETIICSTVCSVLGALMLWVYFIKGSIHSYDTDIWRITLDKKTGFRSLVPINGNWTNTLIWFHDFNEDSKLAQSFFYEDKYYAEKTKVVFIQSP